MLPDREISLCYKGKSVNEMLFNWPVHIDKKKLEQNGSKVGIFCSLASSSLLSQGNLGSSIIPPPGVPTPISGW